MRPIRLCHGLRHGLNLVLLGAACVAVPAWAGMQTLPASPVAAAAATATASAPAAALTTAAVAAPALPAAPGAPTTPAPHAPAAVAAVAALASEATQPHAQALAPLAATAPTLAAAPAAPPLAEPTAQALPETKAAASVGKRLSDAIDATTHEAAAAWLAVREVVQGQVSFYGAYFAGRPTANGERFDPNAMTMAHRHLPFGTLVRVTNLKSGHSVVVRVNDRGPFIAGRVADLSKAAAAQIRMLQQGVVHARLEVLGPAKANAQSGRPTAAQRSSPGAKAPASVRTAAN